MDCDSSHMRNNISIHKSKNQKRHNKSHRKRNYQKKNYKHQKQQNYKNSRSPYFKRNNQTSVEIISPDNEKYISKKMRFFTNMKKNKRPKSIKNQMPQVKKKNHPKKTQKQRIEHSFDTSFYTFQQKPKVMSIKPMGFMNLISNYSIFCSSQFELDDIPNKFESLNFYLFCHSHVKYLWEQSLKLVNSLSSKKFEMDHFFLNPLNFEKKQKSLKLLNLNRIGFISLKCLETDFNQQPFTLYEDYLIVFFLEHQLDVCISRKVESLLSHYLKIEKKKIRHRFKKIVKDKTTISIIRQKAIDLKEYSQFLTFDIGFKVFSPICNKALLKVRFSFKADLYLLTIYLTNNITFFVDDTNFCLSLLLRLQTDSKKRTFDMDNLNLQKLDYDARQRFGVFCQRNKLLLLKPESYLKQLLSIDRKIYLNRLEKDVKDLQPIADPHDSDQSLSKNWHVKVNQQNKFELSLNQNLIKLDKKPIINNLIINSTSKSQAQRLLYKKLLSKPKPIQSESEDSESISPNEETQKFDFFNKGIEQFFKDNKLVQETIAPFTSKENAFINHVFQKMKKNKLYSVQYKHLKKLENHHDSSFKTFSRNLAVFCSVFESMDHKFVGPFSMIHFCSIYYKVKRVIEFVNKLYGSQCNRYRDREQVGRTKSKRIKYTKGGEDDVNLFKRVKPSGS